MLVIGKIPPPIGGVTIHVSRLLDVLRLKQINFTHIDLTKSNIGKILCEIIKHKKIHLHTSSVIFQFILSLWACVFNRTLIITYHGDLKRYGKLKTILAHWSIKLCSIPVVLNYSSYTIALKLNSKSLLISSFIPPTARFDLEQAVILELEKANQKFRKVFCTSGTGITFDVNGDEIYGVFGLIEIFNSLTDYCLVICDSSSQYKNYVQENNIKICENIIFISEPHSMFEVLKLCDGFIRNTSTDGDSVAIKESLFLNKLTLASNVVDRPIGVHLFNRTHLDSIIPLLEMTPQEGEAVDGSLELIKIYTR